MFQACFLDLGGPRFRSLSVNPAIPKTPKVFSLNSETAPHFQATETASPSPRPVCVDLGPHPTQGPTKTAPSKSSKDLSLPEALPCGPVAPRASWPSGSCRTGGPEDSEASAWMQSPLRSLNLNSKDPAKLLTPNFPPSPRPSGLRGLDEADTLCHGVLRRTILGQVRQFLRNEFKLDKRLEILWGFGLSAQRL